jgi:anti-anti-sigma factor
MELQFRDGIFVLRFLGRFATGTDAEYLEGRMEDIRGLAGCRVLADFREVTSIGSTGLAFAISIFKCVTSRPTGLFVIAGVNPRVRRAFDIAHLTGLIPVADDIDSGLAALRQVPARFQGDGAVCTAP